MKKILISPIINLSKHNEVCYLFKEDWIKYLKKIKFELHLYSDSIKNYNIYERSGIKIGVFGLGIELKGLVNPNLYKETKYIDPIEVSDDMVRFLKKEEKCDLIICVSHLGHYYDSSKISDIKLAKITSGIDLIIGGHTHTFLEKPEIIRNKDGKNVIINQVGTRGVYMGKIDFSFTNLDKKATDSILEV